MESGVNGAASCATVQRFTSSCFTVEAQEQLS